MYMYTYMYIYMYTCIFICIYIFVHQTRLHSLAIVSMKECASSHTSGRARRPCAQGWLFWNASVLFFFALFHVSRSSSKLLDLLCMTSSAQPVATHTNEQRHIHMVSTGILIIVEFLSSTFLPPRSATPAIFATRPGKLRQALLV